MEKNGQFQEWVKVKRKLEVRSADVRWRINNNDKIRYEDLLNLETYHLLKLLKKM